MRRLPATCALVVALALALIMTGFTPRPASAHRVTCSAFASQAAAQADYNSNPAGHRNLDRDGDGVACESNPAPYAPPHPRAPAPAPAPIAAPPAPAPAVAVAPEGWVRVVRIVDGDTVDVDTPSGAVRVRFYGTDTPERGETCFADANAALERLLTDNGRDWWVSLEYGPRTTDPYGRTLAYVWVQGDGRMELVDWWMVALGYARAWTADGQYRDAIAAAQDEATASGRGCLWG